MFLHVNVDDVVKFDLDDLLDCRLGVVTENEYDIAKGKEIDGEEYFENSCFCVIAPTSVEFDVHATHLSYITNEGDIREIRELTEDELSQVAECIKNSSWVNEEVEELKRCATD